MEGEEINGILELLKSNVPDDIRLANNILEARKIILTEEQLHSLLPPHINYNTIWQDQINYHVVRYYSSSPIYIEDRSRIFKIVQNGR